MATFWCLGPILGLFLLCIVGAKAGDYCYSGYRYSYCPYGCCGSYDHYCCSASASLIVGCVFAGIAGLCIIISLIYCCVKKQGQPGRVIHPGAANVAVVQSQSNAAFSQPAPYGMGMGYPAMPPHALPTPSLRPCAASLPLLRPHQSPSRGGLGTGFSSSPGSRWSGVQALTRGGILWGCWDRQNELCLANGSVHSDHWRSTSLPSVTISVWTTAYFAV